nr:MAG TPA: hypothetical protein [Caudoviricetes sp.]
MSLENQNLGSLSNRIAQISRVNADFLLPKFFYGRLQCY